MMWTALAAVLVAAAAAWFIARPLRRLAPSEADTEDGDGLVRQRDRLLAQLRELDAEVADGNIDATVAADERLRLEADLAQVLERLEAAPPSGGRARAAPHRRLWLAALAALAVMLPLAAAGLYFAQHGPVLAQLDQLQALARGEVPPVVRDMVARLEQRLAEQPNDPEGWARLGRAYAVLGRDSDARRAYAQALEQAPENIGIVADYADFLLSLSPVRPSAETVALFRRVHAADPDHPGALWVLGVAAYQADEFNRAVEYWERLLALLPPEHELAAELRRALDTTRVQAAEQQ